MRAVREPGGGRARHCDQVFPETDHKFWLDASPEERARRRRSQGHEENLAYRDRQDSQRAAAPLMLGLGAIRIDTTGRPVPEIVAEIARAVAAPPGKAPIPA